MFRRKRRKKYWAGGPGLRRVRKKRMSMSLMIFLVGMLVTIDTWDKYLHSSRLLGHAEACQLILVSGLLLSTLLGTLFWMLETQARLIDQKKDDESEDRVRRDLEHKITDAASIAVCWFSQVIFTDQRDDSLFESAIHLLKKVLVADEVALMLLNTDKELYIAAASGLSESAIATTRVKLGERIAGRAAICKREFLINGSCKNYPEFHDVEDNPNIHSSIVVPLIIGPEIMGVLCLNRTLIAEDFTEIHLRHAMILTQLMAQVLYNEKIRGTLESKESELKFAQMKLRDLGMTL